MYRQMYIYKVGNICFYKSVFMTHDGELCNYYEIIPKPETTHTTTHPIRFRSPHQLRLRLPNPLLLKTPQLTSSQNSMPISRILKMQ